MPDYLPASAKLLVSDAEIRAAIARLAGELNARFADESEAVVVLTVMNGALVFAGQLIPQLRFPIVCDYLHPTRYDEQNSAGEVVWKAKPSTSLVGRTVIVLDDILDQGVTAAAIKSFCEQGGARHISFAMMVAKPSFCRKIAFDADFIGLPIPDEFVFGMGMDYSGLYRNLPAIYCFCSDQ